MADDVHRPGADAAAPILEFDPSREAIVEARNVPYIRRRDASRAEMPRRVLLCYFQDVIRLAVDEYDIGVDALVRLEDRA